MQAGKSGTNRGINWDEQPLGLRPDADLARDLHVNESTVRGARKLRGISRHIASHLPEPSTLRPLVFDTEPAPMSSEPASNDNESIGELVAFCRKVPRTLEDVCDKFEIGPTKARALLQRARECGRPIEIQGGRLSWFLPEEHANAETRLSVAQPTSGWNTFAVVGDIHYGSKYCRDDYLADFCQHAYARGARTFFQLGDILDGEYRHGIRELRAHGFDEQADECIAKLPRMPDAHWLFIDGNHDETFSHSAGMVCGRALEERARSAGRTDMSFLGQRRGVVRLDSGHEYAPMVELWHPKQGKAYAESYRQQKRIEGYSPGNKPDFLFVGHLHSYCAVVSRGVHSWVCGTFQGQGSAYSNSLAGGVALGGLVVHYTLTETGTLRNVASEWISYYEREDVKRVQLGAAA